MTSEIFVVFLCDMIHDTFMVTSHRFISESRDGHFKGTFHFRIKIYYVALSFRCRMSTALVSPPYNANLIHWSS